MLPKDYRLSREGDIVRALRKGRMVKGAFVSLYVSGSSLKNSRFGVIVSKKVHNKPTRRNLVKRRLRYIFSKYFQQIKPGHDCLVVARPGILNQDFQQIEQEVLKLFARARLLKKKEV